MRAIYFRAKQRILKGRAADFGAFELGSLTMRLARLRVAPAADACKSSLVPNFLNFFDFSHGYGKADSWFESHSLRQSS